VKAQCEVCGSPLRSAPNRVEIDGATMIVCTTCARLGKPIGPAFNPKARPSQFQNSFQNTFKSASQPRIEPEYEVDPDYYLLIRQAREKAGLSQEQLGMVLNVKPSVIKMVESKKLKPDIALTRKLMHQLKINLLVSMSELEGGAPPSV
jgi:putative transcription factor